MPAHPNATDLEDRMRIFLTDMAIQKLSHPDQGQQKYRDTALPGFGLIVGKRTKTFFVTYGKERRNQTLGRYPSVSLKDARRRALEIIDGPNHTPTRLPELVRLYLKDREPYLRYQSLRRYRGILSRAPDIPITEATKTLARSSHEVAAYKAMFNWAIREGHTSKNPFAHLSTSYGKRERILSDEELKAIWHYEQPPYSDILKLLILTGQRRNQIWQLNPEWIENDLIHFPASIMKTGHAHTIPVGDIARRYLNAPFSFNGWGKSKARLDKHISSYLAENEPSYDLSAHPWTLHDLRRTFVTLHARIGTPLHVTEAYVAHRSGELMGGIRGVYNRHNYLEEMRKAVVEYERHIIKIVTA